MQTPKFLVDRLAIWILAVVCYISLAGVLYAFASKNLPGWVALASLFTALIGAPSLLGFPIYFHRKGYLTGPLRRDAYIGAVGAAAFLLVLVVTISITLESGG